jgi:type VI secretion system protein
MAAARQGSSLLRRLQRDADPTSAGRSYYRGEDLEAVVLDHLREMLGTRMGSALTVPDYGMIEVSDMLYEFPDAIGIIQRGLKTTLAKYEPRLKNVQVRSLEAGEDESRMFLYFEITAQLLYPNGERQAIRFTTKVDESSSIEIGQ